MLSTVIGTLTHELGHIAVAKFLGYDAYIHYGSMNFLPKGYNDNENVKERKKIYEEFSEAINSGKTFKKEDRYIELGNDIKERFPNSQTDSTLVTLGGPIQTMLTCFLGLYILSYRKSRYKLEFRFLDWLGVFLSLFVLREVFNLSMALGKTLLFVKTNFSGDEFILSRSLFNNQWLIPVMMGAIGLIISVYLVFEIIPAKYRITFIISGFIGGIFGYIIWFRWFGEIILP